MKNCFYFFVPVLPNQLCIWFDKIYYMRLMLYIHLAIVSHILFFFLPEMTVRRRDSQLLRSWRERRLFNPSLLVRWWRNERGVTGFIFHSRIESTNISILLIVFASNTYFVSSTCSNPFIHNLIKTNKIINPKQKYSINDATQF